MCPSGINGFPTLAEQWNGTSWSIVATPNAVTGALTANLLDDVSADASNDVWAVGQWVTQDTSQPLAERFDGTKWNIVPIPTISFPDQGQLYGVSVRSASDVWAVGTYQVGIPSHDEALIEHWTGTSWSGIRLLPNNASQADLRGVVALGPNNVWAVGSQFLNATLNQQALLLHWDGTAWLSYSSPTLSGSPILQDAAASGASDVWAVGSTNSQTLAEHWDGAGWSVVASPNPGTNSQFTGVTELSTGDTWASGTDGSDFPLVEKNNCAPAAPDLAITNVGAPNPVTADSNLTYTDTVFNSGAPASGVTVTDTLPSDVIVRSATPSQGTCSGTSTVTCNLGTISGGGSATVTIVVTPITPETITNTATVSPTDATPGDNSSTASTTVSAAAKTKYVSLRDSGFSPTTASSAQGNTVQWNFLGPSPNSVTDATGIGLFASGTITPVNYFQFKYTAAGIYQVVDALSHTSKAKVPIKVSPSTGTTSTTFTITWASTTPPAGDAFDVQVAYCPTIPCTPSYTAWKTGVTVKSATFGSADPLWHGTGTYYFQARLRNTGNTKSSGWSNAKTITVS